MNWLRAFILDSPPLDQNPHIQEFDQRSLNAYLFWS